MGKEATQIDGDLRDAILSHLDHQQTSQQRAAAEMATCGGPEPLEASDVDGTAYLRSQWPEATAWETQFRHGGWIPNRIKVASALTAASVPAGRLFRFTHCGSDCVVEENSKTGELRLRANYCGDRFCTPCANARSVEIRQKIRDLMGTGRHSMATLTLRAADAPLPEIIDKLLKSFVALRRRAFWKKAVDGGAYFLELTRGAHGTQWHVHLHLLLACRFIDWATLRAAWHEITKDSHVVHIRAVDRNNQGALYASKYATKGFDQSVVNDQIALREAVLALRGRRLIGTFGTWHGVELDNISQDYGTWTVVGRRERLGIDAAAGSADAILILRRLAAKVGNAPFRTQASGSG